MTFDVRGALLIEVRGGWEHFYELFCVCRHCLRSTTFVVNHEWEFRDLRELASAGALLEVEGSLNHILIVQDYVSLRDVATHAPPEHISPQIEAAYRQGATCVAVQCWDAAGTMFRKCVDLATRPMLPDGETEGLNARTRRDLGLRLQWLFNDGHLPAGLRELSSCIREDGNDGAHAGTLRKEDAEDLLDFTDALLERLFTEPERLRLAEERRKTRRAT